MPDLLIDPDCRDGKCGSCVGGACEHDCHARVQATNYAYVHPQYGVLARAEIVWTEPPSWVVEATGLVGQIAAHREAVTTEDGARNVLRRVGEAGAAFNRNLNAALSDFAGAQRVTAAPAP